MSKKIVVNIITVFVIAFIVTGLYMFNNWYIERFFPNIKKVDNLPIDIKEKIEGISHSGTLTEAQKLSIKEKKSRIDTIKKKLALKWLIMKWDINIKNQEYTIALTKYLKVHKEVPDDKETIKKLWDIYFFLKKFKNSYSYYEKIKDYDKLIKDKIVISLLFSKIPSWENLNTIAEELEKLWLTEEKL